MLTIYFRRDILSTIHLFQLADPDRRSPTTCSGAIAMATEAASIGVSPFLSSASPVYPPGEWEGQRHTAEDNSPERKTTAWTRFGPSLPGQSRRVVEGHPATVFRHRWRRLEKRYLPKESLSLKSGFIAENSSKCRLEWFNYWLEGSVNWNW